MAEYKMNVDRDGGGKVDRVNVNLPSNSHKSKAENTRGEESRKVVPKQVKTPGHSKSILAEDFASVGSYVLMDILIPMLRDTIYKIVTSSMSMFLYGDSKPGDRANRDNRTYVSYGGYFNKPDQKQEAPQTRARGRYDFSGIIFATRDDAQEVLDNMARDIQKYDDISVADFYRMIGQKAEYTDQKYGWVNVDRARIVPVKDGYVLDMPRPVLLD